MLNFASTKSNNSFINLLNQMNMSNINIQMASELKNKAEAKYIAQTIVQQMQCPNMMIYFSWGATNFGYGRNTDSEPFVKFHVNGMKFQGYVYIVYDFSDTYKIAFVDHNGNTKHEVEMVYADQLQKVIDDYVEKIDEYVI